MHVCVSVDRCVYIVIHISAKKNNETKGKYISVLASW